MSSRGRSCPRTLRWLTLLSIFVGLLSIVSYATGAAILLRMAQPGLGASWDANQFYFMEGAATALGLLIAIRLGRRLISEGETATRSTMWSAIAAAIAFAPLIHLCSTAARLGPENFGFGAQDWVIGQTGYEIGKQLDKVLIAGIYFLKTACLALIAGLALVAIVVALVFVSGAGAEAVPVDPSVQS